MNSSVIFMEKENIDQSTIRHHMINKNTHLLDISDTSSPKTQFSFVSTHYIFEFY